MRKFLPASAGLLLLLLPAAAQAQLPWVYCGNLPGCTPGFAEHITGAMTQLIIRFDVYAYILGALFVMIGGGMIVLSGFSEEMVNKGKQTITWALIGVFIGKFASLLVSFVTMEANSVGSGELVVAVINTAIGSVLDLFRVGLFGVVIYCGMRMVVARGKSDELEKARSGLIWAAIGAIIINLAQVITNAIATL
ncbi:MAG TPA: hypothetical protein PKV72_00405 [Candidatus Peribacteria bacterium]|nr:hypothetical protein [Candidatus Peribacteria bacterium]